MIYHNFLLPRKWSEGCLKLLLLIVLTSTVNAQVFTRITTGDIISDQRGSRGSAWGDYNGDGNIDLFLTDIDTVNYLYRNNGNGTFNKILSGAIATDAGLSNSASWGDYDNDSDLDLFVAIRDTDRLFYRNNGNNTFTRITTGAPVTDNTDARGVSWVDYDNDGNLDLFIVNKSESNQLYKGNGSGGFTAITSGSIVTDNGNSSGGIWGDYDSDGDLDLFIPNDGDGSNEKNFLYENNGNGTFTAINGGPVVNNGGDSESAVWADFDNDGDLDLFVANDGPNGDAVNFLYENNGNGNFSRAADIDTQGNDTEDCSVADYDNDGDLDIFIANNNSQNNALYRNDGNLNFTIVQSINVVNDGGESEGASWADYDNDGDQDLFVANDEQLNFLYRNSGNANRWLKVNLTGTVSNTTAIGARIRIRTNGTNWQIREVSGQTSAKSQNDLTTHFGIGNALTIDSVIVSWPSGLTSRLANVNSNQLVSIVEGVVNTPPVAPQNLTAAALTTTDIRLDWTANADSPRTYYIYRSLISGSGYALIDSVAHPGTTYQNSGLGVLTTYYYRISAVNDAGESGFSNEANATTNGVPPSVPTGLSATAASASAIDLNWTASLNQPVKYYIFRSNQSGTGFLLHDSVNAPLVSYSDTGLQPQTRYYYKLSATNVWGTSGQSGEVTAITNGLPPGIPLSASALATSATTIDVAWQASSNLPLRYVISRGPTNTGPFSPIDSVDQAFTSYADTNLIPETSYYYAIEAVNSWGRSGFSNVATAMTFGLAPHTPVGFSVTEITTDSVTLEWTAAINNPADYLIYRSLLPGSGYTLYDSVSSPILSYVDMGVTPLTTYYYRLSARNQWGESALSDSVQATPPPAGAPTPPQALTATPVSGSQIDLSWTASSGLPLRYRIYRSLTELDAFAFTVIDSVDHPVTSYSNSGLNSSTTYFYQVRAVNSIGESAPSNTGQATTNGPPLPAANLQITSVGSDSISLLWAPSNDGNPQYYRIFRAGSAGGPFSKIDSVPHPQNTFTNTGLTPATGYFYHIDAVNNFGSSAISNQVSETTNGVAPVPPTALQATVLSPTQASLTWQAPSGELEQYYIYRSTVTGSGYALIDSVDHPTTAYSDNSLMPETRYFYVVSASNIWGESPFSNEDSVDTPGIIPSAPGSILAQGISESRIDLSWKSSRFAEKYRVFRSLTSGAGYALIDSVNAPDSSYSDLGLDPNTEYFYQITAQNIWGESAPSEEVSATTGNSGAPSAPEELTVNPVSTTELRLEWLASTSGNPLCYRIFRSETPGSGFIAVDSVNHPQTVYINAGLSPSTQYFYRVSALNEFGESPASAEANATTFGAPTVPEGLTAIAISAGQIDLGWDVSSGEPVRYQIFRSLSSGGGFALIDSVDHPLNNYADSTLNELTTYYYKVAALNQWGVSAQTAEVTATTPGSGTPTAPTNLIAGTVSNTQLLLSWETSTANPERYRIYRSLLPQSGYIRIDSTVHPVAGYVDSGLQPSTTYYYRVSAVNGSGESPASNNAVGTTFGPPSQPMNPNAQPLSTSEINLSWAASSGNPARYRVYRSLNSGSGFTKVDSVSHPATGITDAQLQSETTYYYFITAFNEWGESISSVEISAETNGQSIVIAPTINTTSISTSPLQPQEGQSITIQVQVDGTNPEVKLVYGKDDNLATGTSIPMTLSGTNIFSAVIPAEAVSSAGAWYRIEAVNSAGSSVSPAADAFYDINIRISDFAAITGAGGYPAGISADGWNTLALPFNTTENISLSALLGTQEFNTNGEPTNWAAYTYSNGSLQSVNSIRGGQAYFLYHTEETPQQINISSAQSNDADTFNEIQLQPGWNLIPWSFSFSGGITIDDPQQIGSIWTQRDNSWTRLTDQLTPTTIQEEAKPYQALAVFNKSTQNIITLGDVISLDNETAKTDKSSSRLDWYVNVLLTGESGSDLNNVLGAAQSAAASTDYFDEAEPPSAGQSNALYFINEDQKLSSDIRPSSSEGDAWEFRVESIQNSELNLQWATEFLPEGWIIQLIDITGNKVYAAEDRQLALKGFNTYKFYLIAGTPDFVNRKSGELEAKLPKQFALYQNYPNPFNGTTRIRFDVPLSGKVRLVVYDLLGREVSEITRSFRETGSYIVEWDGTTGTGSTAGSGLYFIRLQGENYSKVIKAMMVK